MVVEGSVEAVAAPGIHEGNEIGMVGSNSGEEDKGRVDEGERSFGGNRWPRQEALALLKIRSDMDSVFRHSSLKGPLWEEVSRKLAELGYHRTAKKCKEKFENVYKYHKRTKDSRRTGKADGSNKIYRFFDQLEALENLHSLQPLSPPKPQTPTPTSAAIAMPWTNPLPASNIHVPSVTVNPTSVPQNNATPPTNPTVSTQADPVHSINPYSINMNMQSSFRNVSSNLFSTSTSSSTASDDDSDRGSSKKKRKWREFFRRLTKEVIEKQEELQNKFLQTIEKYEQERMAREEAWRIQEMARINRENESFLQERSTAAASDAAVVAFLQKISGQQTNTVQLQPPGNPQPAPPPPVPALPPTFQQPPLQQPQPQPQQPTQTLNFDTLKMTNGGNNAVSPSPSRWPKAEVQALIKLRTNVDIKYQENGPKAPLWEEISAAMRKLGYNRSAKRCKEKWENINKYFKKVKESNKTRPEDSKTCPYFHQLYAIYKDKIIKNDNSLDSSSSGVKPDSTMVPLMVRPEQQWPPPQQEISQQAEAAAMLEEAEREKVDQIQDDEEEEEEDGDSTEEEYEGNDFEVVAKKLLPLALPSETTKGSF